VDAAQVIHVADLSDRWAVWSVGQISQRGQLGVARPQSSSLASVAAAGADPGGVSGPSWSWSVTLVTNPDTPSLGLVIKRVITRSAGGPAPLSNFESSTLRSLTEV
jgi:hypothetical protein